MKRNTFAIVKRTSDPCIASRHGESTKWKLVFKGSKAECEAELLRIANDEFGLCEESLRAVAKKRSGRIDSVRTVFRGFLLESDSRIWLLEPMNKANFNVKYN